MELMEKRLSSGTISNYYSFTFHEIKTRSRLVWYENEVNSQGTIIEKNDSPTLLSKRVNEDKPTWKLGRQQHG